MRKLLLAIIITGTAQLLAFNAFAQEDATEASDTTAPTDAVEDSGVPEESIYKNEADILMENKVEKIEKKTTDSTTEAAPAAKMKSLSELDKLTPFNDIAVIQKRFLPKSQRFEFNPSLGLITNNAFFMTTFFQGRMGYAFTEKWALEFTAAFFMDSDYRVTRDLKDKANVATASLLLPESYYGFDIRWSPIYGKMGMFSSGIVPFDMYFSGGGGVMGTNQSEDPFALHAGTGQIFAINKWMAFRWDLSMYFYSCDVAPAGTAGGGAKTNQSFTDIQLSLGMSFFFPEATYR